MKHLRLNNLIAEMNRFNIRNKDMADILGISESAISMKLRGLRKFTSDETMAIKNIFFPNCKYEYLFDTTKQINK